MLNRSLTSHPESGIEWLDGLSVARTWKHRDECTDIGLSTGEHKENKRHTPLMLSKISKHGKPQSDQ